MRLFHYLKADHALLALRHQRLKVARISDLNDPFELLCADMRDPKARKGFRQFRERISATHGFLCFSKNWRNLLMWSHYADKHKGAVLEIEIDDDHAMPVKYRKSRLQWDVAKIMASGGFTQQHVDALTTTKSVHWKYEQEVRVAVSLKDDTPDENGRYFATVAIKGVVLGEFSTLSLVQISEALPIGSELPVTRARLAFRTFNVVERKDVPITAVRGEHDR